MKGDTVVNALSERRRPWSYSSTRVGLTTRAVEAFYLVRTLGGRQDARVAFTLDTWRAACRRIRESTGVEIAGRRILDVGPGQQLRHMRCFSLANQVVGIDLDPVPCRLGLRQAVQLVRAAPAMRAIKTVLRKALGFDARFERALGRALGVRRFGDLTVLRMNAERMAFADASFDVVYSCSCFEHLPRPAEALHEAARVLVPGGVAYISIHHYTSHSGAHDAAICGRPMPEPPYWPHLRPKARAILRPTAYVNEVRFQEWTRLFEEAMPGTCFVQERQDYLAQPLLELRASGELGEYTDDELLTLNFIGIWKKPS